jgi:hypothetical protein
MGEESEPFGAPRGFAVDDRLIALTTALGHGAGNRIVKASVQRPKVAVLIGALSSTASSVMA